MTDPELEELLRRYRPAGPPTELRARVVANATPVRRAWPWAAAAAALLAGTVYLNRSVDHFVATANITPGPDSRTQAISLLSDILGGDASARSIAELTFSVDEMRVERDRGSAAGIGTLELR